VTGRVLVTGGSGLVGAALLEALRASGADAVGLSSRDADLTDFAATCAAFERHRPELVFHLAARVRGIMGNHGVHGQAYLDNIRIGTNAIEAARLAGARKVVAMGSSAVYGDAVTLPMRESEVWTGPPHPSEAGYAHAKRAMLAQLESYHDQWGLDYAYCISTNLFGPNDRFDERYGHVLPSLISKFHRAVRGGERLTVWGTGAPRRDFLYVKDAARALLLIAEAFTGPINLATGVSMSIRETVELIADVSGYSGEVEWDATKPDGQRLRDYDVTRLAALGFTPRWTLREALAETFAWFDANAATARR
jgi:GDP-L-fucose synthase